jgi:hypothetical protein
MEYQIKPFKEISPFFAELDLKRRAKVEKAAGKPMTNEEWRRYKIMTMPKHEKQK